MVYNHLTDMYSIVLIASPCDTMLHVAGDSDVQARRSLEKQGRAHVSR